MTRAAIVLLVIAGCGKPTADRPTHPAGSNDPMTMTKPGAQSQATFVRGPSLTPKDQLVAWLDRQQRAGEPRLVRLVVVLPRTDLGFDISKARIGADPDALEVYANDSALGVGLADRADGTCGDAASCAFRVEGYWRGAQVAGLQFDVNKAELLPTDQVSTVTFAEVEGESGN